jgi:hypothetical protein
LIKDLNVKLETLKLLQERIGETLEQLGIGSDFLNRTPIAQQVREMILTWTCIKLEIILLASRSQIRSLEVAQEIPQMGADLVASYVGTFFTTK